MRWQVICNGARWSGSFASLAIALRMIGDLAERADNNETRDWVIEIVRVDAK